MWIHGGAYETGSSALSIYDGKTLVGLNDIILVSINYRLGAFGFLATGDGRISGMFETFTHYDILLNKFHSQIVYITRKCEKKSALFCLIK